MHGRKQLFFFLQLKMCRRSLTPISTWMSGNKFTMVITSNQPSPNDQVRTFPGQLCMHPIYTRSHMQKKTQLNPIPDQVLIENFNNYILTRSYSCHCPMYVLILHKAYGIDKSFLNCSGTATFFSLTNGQHTLKEKKIYKIHFMREKETLIPKLKVAKGFKRKKPHIVERHQIIKHLVVSTYDIKYRNKKL